MLAREVAKTGSLGAEDDAQPLDVAKALHRRLALGGKPGDMDAILLQPFDCARKIDHPDHGNMFERPGGGAGQRPDSSGALRCVVTTAVAPSARPLRSTAPTLRGSDSWSRRRRQTGPSPDAASNSSRSGGSSGQTAASMP